MASKTPKPTLLIDGDVIAYQAASAAQKDVTYPEDGLVYRWSYQADGEKILDDMMERLKADFEPKRMVVYLSETTPMRPNWRLKVFPDYKANRVGLDRPQLLSHLRGYIREKWGASSQPGLEADDLLGITATTMLPAENAIICSIDKDLRTIPGRIHILGNRDRDTGAPVIETVTESEAKLWHMAQALAGDRVDNYGGCPGIGMTRALRLLDNPVVLHPEEGVVTRGPRKGERTTKWVSQPTNDVWACIVSHYVKEGLGEEEALAQARVSYILQSDDYDWATGEVRLWAPYQ